MNGQNCRNAQLAALWRRKKRTVLVWLLTFALLMTGTWNTLVAEELIAIGGETAQKLYQTLRRKTERIQSFYCDAEVLSCRVGPDQAVPAPLYGDCSKAGPFPVWQEGDQARWQTKGQSRTNHPAVTYVADPISNDLFIHWRWSAVGEGVGEQADEQYRPQSRLGARWKFVRNTPIEILDGMQLHGKPVTVIRQRAEESSTPFWGWAIWVETETGLAVRVDGVSLSMLPDVRFVHVAECQHVRLEDIPDELFVIPPAQVVWPRSSSLEQPSDR